MDETAETILKVKERRHQEEVYSEGVIWMLSNPEEDLFQRGFCVRINWIYLSCSSPLFLIDFKHTLTVQAAEHKVIRNFSSVETPPGSPNVGPRTYICEYGFSFRNFSPRIHHHSNLLAFILESIRRQYDGVY